MSDYLRKELKLLEEIQIKDEESKLDEHSKPVKSRSSSLCIGTTPEKIGMEIHQLNEMPNIFFEEMKYDIPYKPASKKRNILFPASGKSASFSTKTIPPKTLKNSSQHFVRSNSLPVEEKLVEMKPCMVPISRSSSVAEIVRTGRQTPTLDRNENRINRSKSFMIEYQFIYDIANIQ